MAAQRTIASSLNRHSTIEEIRESGLIVHRDGVGSFIFRLQGIDSRFYEPSDWARLHALLRPLLKLNPQEELQWIFRKSFDFEEYVSRRFNELNLLDNPFTRRLYYSHLSEILNELGQEEPRLFTSRLLLCARFPFGSAGAEAVEAKMEPLQLALRSVGLTPILLKAAAVSREMATAAWPDGYVAESATLHEWPALSISARELLVESHRFRALTLESLPEQSSETGMMRALTELPVPLTISARLRGADPEPVKSRLRRKRRMLHAVASGRAGGDPELVARLSEIDDLLRRLVDQNDSVLSLSLTVAVKTSREHDAFARRALTEILNCRSRLGHLELSESTLGRFDCYLETVPGLRGQIDSSHTVLGSNGVDFLPLYMSPRSDPRPVVTFRTRQRELFSIDPTDPNLANFNWLVSGTSGSGKSFFVNSLLAQSLSLNPRLFILDVGGSYNKLTRFLGGEIVQLNTERKVRVSPFFVSRSPEEREDRRRLEHVTLIFLEMVRDNGQLPGIEERALLGSVIEEIWMSGTVPDRPVSAARDRLRLKGERATRRLRARLDRWCAPAFYGELLDHARPMDADCPILTVDLQGVGEFEDLSRVLQLILCSTLWNQVRAHRGQFTFIVLDEVAFTLLKSQPHFVDELVSTIRKYNAAVITIVQDLEKITANPAGASILQNSQIKAILQQRGDPHTLSGPLNLKPSEISAIQSLDRKSGSFSDVFLMIDDRRAVVRHVPSALEYLLGTSTPAENRLLEERFHSFSGTYQEYLLQWATGAQS